MTIHRDAHGRIMPGSTANPGGRPKGVTWFRKACQERTQMALAALEAALLREEHAVAAAKVLLEFGWGKAPSDVPADDDESETPTAEEAAAAADRLRAPLDS